MNVAVYGIESCVREGRWGWRQPVQRGELYEPLLGLGLNEFA